MSAQVVVQEWVSVDGYASGRGGLDELFAAVPPAADDASMEYNRRRLGTVSEVLLGRRTYEAFAAFWPGAVLPVADAVNGASKVVVSRSLERAPWGDLAPAQVARDAVGHVRRRRAEADGDLLVWGSLDVVATLLAAGLVDQLDLFVAPVVLGAGTPLLPRGRRHGLRLADAETWSGVVHARYLLEATS